MYGSILLYRRSAAPAAGLLLLAVHEELPAGTAAEQQAVLG
jgi:hypothetical protein